MQHRSTASLISLLFLCGSAEHCNDLIGAACREHRNDIACNSLTVHSQRLDALGNMIRILDRNLVGCAAELTCDLEITEAVRYARIDGKSLVSGIYAEDVL